MAHPKQGSPKSVVRKTTGPTSSGEKLMAHIHGVSREVEIKEFFYEKIEGEMLHFYLVQDGDFFLNGPSEVFLVVKWDGRIRQFPVGQWNDEAPESYILSHYTRKKSVKGIRLERPITKANTTYLLGYGNFVGSFESVIAQDGHFGDVAKYKMQYPDFGPSETPPKEVAGKVLSSESHVKVTQELKEALVELARVFSPFTARPDNHYVAPFGLLIRKTSLLIATEIMQPLTVYLESPLSGEALKNLCLQAALGMKFLASKGYAHGCLSTVKCFIARDAKQREVLRISGYWSRLYDQRPHYYDAPEMPLGNCRAAGEPADVYSFGILVFDIFSKGYVTLCLNQVAPVSPETTNVMDPQSFFVVGPYQFRVPDGMPHEIVDLGRKCMITDVRSRPAFANICQELSAAGASERKSSGTQIKLSSGRKPSFIKGTLRGSLTRLS